MVITEEDLDNQINYINYNPVKHVLLKTKKTDLILLFINM